MLVFRGCKALQKATSKKSIQPEEGLVEVDAMPERIGYTRAFTRQEEINSVTHRVIPEPVPAQGLTPDLAYWGGQIRQQEGHFFGGFRTKEKNTTQQEPKIDKS